MAEEKQTNEENINNTQEETKEEKVQETQEGSDNKDPNGPVDRIITQEIEDEMKQSYMDYAMSVIVGRALPDARDGLKPVHRRVMYTMHTTGVTSTKPYRKSANVVGNCMARYHPHGDSSIYDTLVRMSQDFSLRYPLVDGQGNFGSIDGDNAAAMRYTEARMAKIAEELLADIEKETVDFVDNFDNSTKEPTVLPTKIPNLLINGTSGIAVGMATNIPPHNLGEVSDAIIALIENPDLEPTDMGQYIKGPDFPTGGIIYGISGVKSAQLTGRGRAVTRCNYHTEERKGNKTNIVVTEIPYMVNKSALLEQIANGVKDKKIEGIVDLRDESDRDGMRIVIELKAGANEDIVMNQLYKHSRLQETFGINTLALVNNEPKTLNIKEMIHYFILHRKDVITKRTEFDLRKAEDKAHVLEGLIIALDHIDEVIEKIKQSKDPASAAEILIKDYNLSERQAKVILEMRLQKLSGLEQEKIRSDYTATLELIENLKFILGSEDEIYKIIKTETEEIKKKYANPRRTQIIEAAETDIDMEDLIDREDMIVSITHAGYVKRVSMDTYKEQKRGGKGVIATGKKEDDFVEDIFVANTHDYLLFFTNRGRLHWLKVYRVPLCSRQAKGTAVVNLAQLEKDEKVTSIVPISSFEDKFIVMCTGNGTIKKVDARLFSKPRKTGVIAITLEEGDELIETKLTDGMQKIIVASSQGKAVKFQESDVRAVGRSAKGVTAIKLKNGDKVVGMVIANDEHTLFTVTKNGFGKRSLISDYRLIKRGGSGVINIVTSDRNGPVVGVKSVTDMDSLVLISQLGQAIRFKAENINIIGRNTQGVTLMKMNGQDQVVAVAKIAESDEDEKETTSNDQNNNTEDNEKGSNDENNKQSDNPEKPAEENKESEEEQNTKPDSNQPQEK